MTTTSIVNLLTLNFAPSKNYSTARFTCRTLIGTAIAITVMAYLAHAAQGPHAYLVWFGASLVVAIFLAAAVISYRIYQKHEKSTPQKGLFETSAPEWSYIAAPLFYTVGWLFNAFISVLTFFIVLVWG